jgi:hypothetical protein
MRDARVRVIRFAVQFFVVPSMDYNRLRLRGKAVRAWINALCVTDAQAFPLIMLLHTAKCV